MTEANRAGTANRTQQRHGRRGTLIAVEATRDPRATAENRDGNESTEEHGVEMAEFSWTAERQEVVAPRRVTWEDHVRRAVDVSIALVVLVVLAPLLLAIALAIKFDSEGPVLYRQLRIGIDRRRGREEQAGRRTLDLGGQPFMMYKFRTMRVDAEEGTGPVWARREDDRVTRVGAFLRRHRLDELPQFWNVLTGDMSVVGPRPERPSLVSDLRRQIHAYQVRHRVRPGITGWAQINQESDQTVDDVRSKLSYDLEYLKRRSLAFDLMIMMRTVPVMVERDIVDGEDGDGSGPAGERESLDDAKRAVGA